MPVWSNKDELNDSGYCALDKPEYTAKVRWIRRGFQKRVSKPLCCDYSDAYVHVKGDDDNDDDDGNDNDEDDVYDDDISVVHRAAVWEFEPWK